MPSSRRDGKRGVSRSTRRSLSRRIEDESNSDEERPSMRQDRLLKLGTDASARSLSSSSRRSTLREKTSRNRNNGTGMSISKTRSRSSLADSLSSSRKSSVKSFRVGRKASRHPWEKSSDSDSSLGSHHEVTENRKGKFGTRSRSPDDSPTQRRPRHATGHEDLRWELQRSRSGALRPMDENKARKLAMDTGTGWSKMSEQRDLAQKAETVLPEAKEDDQNEISRPDSAMRGSYASVYAGTVASTASNMLASLFQNLNEEEVQTVEKTKTKTSDQKHFYRSSSQPVLSLQSRKVVQDPQTPTKEKVAPLSSMFRFSEEEVNDDFEHQRVKQGIETARKKQKTRTKSSYEVDAPRSVGLAHDVAVPWEAKVGSQLEEFSDEEESEGMDSLDELLHPERMETAKENEGTNNDSVSLDSRQLPTNESITSLSIEAEPAHGPSEEGDDVEVNDIDHAEAVIKSFDGILTVSERRRRARAQTLLDRRGSGELSLPSLESIREDDEDVDAFEEDVRDYDLGEHEAFQGFMAVFLPKQEAEFDNPSKTLTDLFRWTDKQNVDRQENQISSKENKQKVPSINLERLEDSWLTVSAPKQANFVKENEKLARDSLGSSFGMESISDKDQRGYPALQAVAEIGEEGSEAADAVVQEAVDACSERGLAVNSSLETRDYKSSPRDLSADTSWESAHDNGNAEEGSRRHSNLDSITDLSQSSRKSGKSKRKKKSRSVDKTMKKKKKKKKRHSASADEISPRSLSDQNTTVSKRSQGSASRRSIKSSTKERKEVKNIVSSSIRRRSVRSALSGDSASHSTCSTVEQVDTSPSNDGKGPDSTEPRKPRRKRSKKPSKNKALPIVPARPAIETSTKKATRINDGLGPHRLAALSKGLSISSSNPSKKPRTKKGKNGTRSRSVEPALLKSPAIRQRPPQEYHEDEDSIEVTRPVFRKAPSRRTASFR